MSTPLEDLCANTAKWDSAITSIIEILVATLVKNGRIEREDVREWLENLQSYSATAAKTPESDADIVFLMLNRLNKSFFGDAAYPQTRILH